ncbi:Glycosyl transferase, family I [Aromatoleum bremense]|uniref:Glycosyltransferase n=2 Tax=Aromatoleum bremense TaxID=76115 RepID=A0ABX1NWS8_9RHOO|nr:glycosyltransferase [Aromatoleum bremense]QTQ32659.1 Glycosyl transferase, family I [Aromatoleum bremense]
MRIGFGVTALANGMDGNGVDGIGNVTRELMLRLARQSDLNIVPYVYAEQPPASMPNASGVGRFGPQALFALAAGRPFPEMQRRLCERVDLVHATDHFVPRLRDVPVLATLMDAIPLAHPEWVSYRFKRLKNELWRRSVRWADHLVTISDFSRQEIVRWFGVAEERVSVVPLGVDGRWFERPTAEARDRVRRAYCLPDRFFVFIGTLQPRKNLELLIAAHGALPIGTRHELPLIVIGRNGWGCNALVARLRAGEHAQVRWLEYVADEDLPALLGLASVMVFPSLYEGFGLPVLEAFAAGVPVIASTASAVPEVAGDAALLVDSFAVTDWRDAMLALAGASSLSNTLRERGRLRARTFSWEQTASGMRAIYERML